MNRDIILNPEGTLLDPQPCLTAAVRFATTVLDCPYRGDVIKGASPVATLAQTLGRSREDALVKEAMVLCADYFVDNIGRDAVPYDGAAKAVAEARGRGQRLIALTDQEWQTGVLERYGIELDDTVPVARNCPFVRQATIMALLRKGALTLGANWVTDWPLELALARELGLSGRFASYGRHGRSCGQDARFASSLMTEPGTALLH